MTTALVTGASGGIGEEFARQLRAEGHDLVLVARTTDKLTRLADELGGTTVVAADLTDAAAPARVAEAAGPVDILINNAGVGDFGRFDRADLDKTLAMIRLNVASLTELTHRCVGPMVERGSGRILNVASTAAFQAGPLMAVYYATKAYVLSFSEAIAEELSGTGVTVTALCPGPTASGFQAGAAMENSRLVRGRSLPSSAEVARSGLAAMHRGKVVHVPGAMNKVTAQSNRMMPRALVRKVVQRLQQE